jgi:hypothetical protein
MTSRRFELRPIASRRLRAALLLLLLLSLLGISQTRLSFAELVVAILALAAIFADAWRRTRMPACTLIFNDRPLGCHVIDAQGQEMILNCKHASVYPWLIVLQFDAGTPSQERRPLGLRRTLALLPDSMANPSQRRWRRLLIWARQLRRQLSSSR